jgi:hypothetical protein
MPKERPCVSAAPLSDKLELAASQKPNRDHEPASVEIATALFVSREGTSPAFPFRPGAFADSGSADELGLENKDES